MMSSIRFSAVFVSENDVSRETLLRPHQSISGTNKELTYEDRRYAIFGEIQRNSGPSR